ncbi:MAG: hypothetical protein O2794_02145 [bacterium]|nr:hypothetical protein [bacterium]
MQHDDVIEKAHELLDGSELHKDDVTLWKERFGFMAPEAMVLFVGVIGNDPGLLVEVTENMKLKIAAVDNGGTEEIIEAERKELFAYLEE